MSSNEIWGARPRDSLTATLHHLVVGTPQPEAMLDFYRRALGYVIQPGEGMLTGVARDRRLGFVNGPAKSLAEAGFALRDEGELDRLRHRLLAAEWPAKNAPSRFFLDSVSFSDPDGTSLSFGLPHADPGVEGRTPEREARLQHVVMASPCPEPIVRFYTSVLGFTLSDYVVDEQGGVRTAFLRSSAEHHSFAVFKAPEIWFDHHSYEAADWNAIRDWSDHFAAEHIRLQWGPGRHGPGNNLFVFIHDPDGNWVEISAELERVEQDRPVGEWPHTERTLNFWGQGLLRS
jgi:catechol 2,3-dioxygenase-like lactoylglutathione lyase family enzyme